MADHSWLVVYPAYINSNRTIVQGRRIPKGKAVPDPKWQEIKDVLEANGNFKVLGEPNAVYPRELDKEPFNVRGRVKYQIINPDQTLQKKTQVLLHLAEMIPKLKSRKQAASGGPASSVPENPGRKGKGKGGKK